MKIKPIASALIDTVKSRNYVRSIEKKPVPTQKELSYVNIYKIMYCEDSFQYSKNPIKNFGFFKEAYNLIKNWHQ